MEGQYADSLQMSPFHGDLESLFQPGIDEDGFKSQYDWQAKHGLSSDLGISQNYHGLDTADLLDTSWLDTHVDLLDLLDSGSILQTSSELSDFSDQLSIEDIKDESKLIQDTSDASSALHYLQSMAEETNQMLAESKLGVQPTETVANIDSADAELVEDPSLYSMMLDMLTKDLDEDQLNVDGLPVMDGHELFSSVTPEDIESLLSSGPSSPASSASPLSTSFSDTDSVFDSSETENSSRSETGKTQSKAKKSRSAPYQRQTPVTKEAKLLERKQRKKQQNKDAATRYRQKKKAESDSFGEEYEEVEKRNHELKEKVSQMTREIQYLKDLMAEVSRERGSLIPKKSK